MTDRGLPNALLEMVRGYLRVEVEGHENLPEGGRALVISNHSGCSGLDAVMLGYTLHKELNRMPQIMARWSFFQLFPFLSHAAQKMGLKPASALAGVSLLKKNHLTVLFPEGVEGAFKPSCDRYHLRPFQPGFLKLALLSGAPIIPSVVIGAEESNINLGAIQFGRRLKGLAIPIPFNFFPFPAKWKIKFLPALDLKGLSRKDLSNRDRIESFADSVREKMQTVINKELKKREFVYFGQGNLIKQWT